MGGGAGRGKVRQRMKDRKETETEPVWALVTSAVVSHRRASDATNGKSVQAGSKSADGGLPNPTPAPSPTSFQCFLCPGSFCSSVPEIRDTVMAANTPFLLPSCLPVMKWMITASRGRGGGGG